MITEIIQYNESENISGDVLGVDLSLYKVPQGKIIVVFPKERYTDRVAWNYTRDGKELKYTPPAPVGISTHPDSNQFFADLDADILFDSVVGNSIYMRLVAISDSVVRQLTAGEFARVQKRWALLKQELTATIGEQAGTFIAAIEAHAANNNIDLVSSNER